MYQRGETVEAITQMKKAAKADGDFAKPHYQMAQIYEMDLEEPEKAEQHYRQALDIKSDNATFAYSLGRVLASQGKHEKAIRQFQRATSIDKKHSKAWFRMGLSQRTLGDHADAVESFMKSIEAAPRLRMAEDDPGGAHYHALADLYVEFGFHDKALKVYENGIENNPKSPRLFQGRGVAQLELTRFSEAAQSFEETLKYDSTQTTALFNLAVAREKMGQPKGAIKALDQFLQVAERANNTARIAAAQSMIQELEKKMKESKKEKK